MTHQSRGHYDWWEFIPDEGLKIPKNTDKSNKTTTTQRDGKSS